MKDGHGTYEWADGKRYEGNFKNGKLDGHGKYKWPDGKRYEGNYKNG